MGLRRLLPSPSMVASLVAVVIASGGAAYAGSTIANNSVGSPQVKTNSLTGADIQNNSIKGADIRNGAVKGQDIVDSGIGTDDIDDGAVQPGDIAASAIDGGLVFNDSLSGLDIVESTLGQVPQAAQALQADQAANAADAAKLGGRVASGYVTTDQVVPLRLKLSYGDAVEVLTNGPIGLEADCRESGSGGQNELRLFAFSRVAGSYVLNDGSGEVPPTVRPLGPGTPDDQRVLAAAATGAGGEGVTAVRHDVDTGFVVGPNAEYVSIDETAVYGLNFAGADCVLVGHVLVVE